MIQQLIKNKTERIKVRRVIRHFPDENIWGDVVQRSLDGQKGSAAAEPMCRSEISELVFTVVGHKNVLRLDIPVEIMPGMHFHQGTADVHAYAQGFPFLIGTAHALRKTVEDAVQQFHTDKQIVSGHIVLGDNQNVLNLDKVRFSGKQSLHLKLIDEGLDFPGIELFQGLIVPGSQLIHIGMVFVGILGNRNMFYGTGARSSVGGLHGSVDNAIASHPQNILKMTRPPEGFKLSEVQMFHLLS